MKKVNLLMSLFLCAFGAGISREKFYFTFRESKKSIMVRIKKCELRNGPSPPMSGDYYRKEVLSAFFLLKELN